MLRSALLRRYAKLGVTLVADGREPWVPEEFLAAHPEILEVSNGRFWEFIEQRTRAVFGMVPELDRVESFFWETHFLNPDRFFPGMHWSRPGHGGWFNPPVLPVDCVARLILAFARGAAAAGKAYGQKGFSPHPWNERLMVEALAAIPADVPLRCSTQMQIGDFNPFLAAPLLLAANQHRPMSMYFDCYGE